MSDSPGLARGFCDRASELNSVFNLLNEQVKFFGGIQIIEVLESV